jgi:hypothetical protein
MEGISDIHIIGFDPTRPPLMQKQPYINLYFELAHKAPEDWCKSFNDMTAKKQFTTRIDPSKGLIIETWVRKPDEIEVVLEELKVTVRECNDAYIERVRRALSTRNVAADDDEGEQGKLNRLVAGLDFSE